MVLHALCARSSKVARPFIEPGIESIPRPRQCLALTGAAGADKQRRQWRCSSPALTLTPALGQGPPFAANSDRRVCYDVGMHHLLKSFLILTLAASPFFAADLAGAWLFRFDTEGGQRDMSVTLTQKNEAVTADFGGQKLEGTFRDGKLQLSGKYTPAEAGQEGQFEITAVLKGQELNGEGKWESHQFTLVAKRAE
jgi:hypothetical protein